MHKISYRNTFSKWDEALPLGNGHFGAMGYNDGNELVYAVNHYDVYYRRLGMYSDGFAEERKKIRPTDTSRYELIQERTIKAHEDPEDPAHYNYNFTLLPEMKEYYGYDRRGETQPFTGELHILFDKSVRGADEFESCLEIENAVHKYNAKTSMGGLGIYTIISQDIDIILTQVKQTGENKIPGIEITIPERRRLEIKTEYKAYNGNTVYFINSFHTSKEERENNKLFKYIFMVRLNNVKVQEVILQDGKLTVNITDAKADFNLLTCVVTEEETADLLETAVKRLDAAERNINEIVETHRKYWSKFWGKSGIRISDSILEKLWYVNLYSLECCSGRGARLYEQACGLNGLWDIKQPSQWGSMWYWDVNIQASFSPVFTSNHLELGSVFCEGLLSYVDLARKRAKEFFGMRGIATDFPHDLYNSIWPWSAQYLWWYYRYSGDAAFLKEKAYPLFEGILLFYEDFLKYDEEKDQYYIFPDVSPEQGPMTRNSTITLACLKFLLKVSISANILLNKSKEDRLRWENIYNKLPYYFLGESLEFGKTIKDSEWAGPTMDLGHPSLFMPVYPIGEISKRSGGDLVEIGENTIKYADSKLAIGTFGFGWTACAAARLGLGDEARRILYEKGIAYSLRINGLFAEETERWLQSCLTSCAPVYNPPLIEGGSETVAAINEMLLQSMDGIIEVFPALPKGGKPDSSLGVSKFGIPLNNTEATEAWKDCCFDNLLAEGAFEVSAYQQGVETSLVKIRSLAGNEAKLINPFVGKDIKVKCGGKAVGFEITENIIAFKTMKDAVYEIKAAERDDINLSRSSNTGDGAECPAHSEDKPEIYVAQSNRRVFLGKNSDTEFLRELDKITFDYYQGESRTSRIAVYRFDFSLPKDQLEKDYRSILPKQIHACGKQGLDFIRVTKNMVFSTFRSYGWDDVTGLKYVDRKALDPFRRDFVSGTNERKFKIEVACGQYQIFFATGDSCEETYTAIDINGQQRWKPQGVIKAGRFEAVTLPVIQYKDGIMDIAVSTMSGFEWKINMMVINRLL
ncbi:MAG: sugar phosphorylase [Ruminiclostridium sp.]|nr:sugar phosphorylase [Ruminiclostridium sp.]